MSRRRSGSKKWAGRRTNCIGKIYLIGYCGTTRFTTYLTRDQAVALRSALDSTLEKEAAPGGQTEDGEPAGNEPERAQNALDIATRSDTMGN